MIQTALLGRFLHFLADAPANKCRFPRLTGDSANANAHAEGLVDDQVV